jgi:hypothetical protein
MPPWGVWAVVDPRHFYRYPELGKSRGRLFLGAWRQQIIVHAHLFRTSPGCADDEGRR